MSDTLDLPTHARIMAAASELIASGGIDAATTRAVSEAAGVQPPTIYRMFGDKRGLLEAVAVAALESYIARKAARAPADDPVADLRLGWDDHIAFSLANPGVFAIMRAVDHHASSPAMTLAAEVLRAKVRRIAQAGRLRISEARALALLQATGIGTILSMLELPAAARDMSLSELTREAVIAAITGEAVLRPGSAASQSATALASSLDDVEVLTIGERAMLTELLERIANG
ncbi:MAG: helix-turn-helix domain-containing protein [Deltaproteobacteria bacterium]